MSVLERMPADQMEVGDGGEVFDKALSAGYTDLCQEAYRRFTSERHSWHHHPNTRQEIMAALSKIGVRPFTPESVQKYKDKIARRLFWSNLPRQSIAVLAVLGLLVGGVGTLLACLGIGIGFLLGVSTTSTIAWVMVALPVFFFIGVGCAALADNINIIRGRWSQEGVDYMTLSDVPDFALQTAIDLDRCCPGCDIYIEEYQEHKETLDPFLAVYVVTEGKGEWIHLEVWNEVGFEKEYEPNWLSFS